MHICIVQAYYAMLESVSTAAYICTTNHISFIYLFNYDAHCYSVKMLTGNFQNYNNDDDILRW